MALAVSECAQIVGVLLVFTLMVGPPAAAQRVSTGLWSGLFVSAALALGEAWLGITIAYYTDWPVSFCIADSARWDTSFVIALKANGPAEAGPSHGHSH